jgi:hypothetical protein
MPEGVTGMNLAVMGKIYLPAGRILQPFVGQIKDKRNNIIAAFSARRVSKQ